MTETPPASERRGVHREAVSVVVEDMLADPRVKWVAVLHEDTVGAVERFLVVSYTSDPTQ
jgi:hypothetical protein